MNNRILYILMIVCFVSCKKTETGGNTAAASVSGLNCTAAVASVAATTGQPYSGTLTVPYSGGNGAAYPAGAPLSSSSVNGLTATLQAGTLATGDGSFVYTITGTPTATGTANFDISFGSISCRAGMISASSHSYNMELLLTVCLIRGMQPSTRSTCGPSAAPVIFRVSLPGWTPSKTLA
jgi:hypothetical protein